MSYMSLSVMLSQIISIHKVWKTIESGLRNKWVEDSVFVDLNAGQVEE